MLTRSYRMARPQQRPRRQTGVTLIELMVGLAVGLIVVSGALILLSTLTQDNRRLLVETRLNQDLRATSDLIVRDLRRAGYTASAARSVYVPGAASASYPDEYQRFVTAECTAGVLGTSGAAASLDPASETPAPPLPICYAIEQGTPNSTVEETELFGFSLDVEEGVIWMSLPLPSSDPTDPTPRLTKVPLTDPRSLKVDVFRIIPKTASFNMSSVCTTSGGSGGPRVLVRSFDIELRGHPPSDPGLIRGVTTTVKVRNDAFSGNCS